MTDIWFLFGATTVDLSLLDFIDQNCVSFRRIGMITQEVAPKAAGDPDVTWITNPAAGYLDASIDTFRRTLRNQCAKSYKSSPIISLYAAAKLCQIWNTSPGQFSRAIRSFNTIYNAAASATGFNKHPVRLVTMLGACMVDDAFAAQVRDPNFETTPEGQAVMAEFGFDAASEAAGPEWKTAKGFVSQKNFFGINGAQTQLLSVPTWTCGCHERVVFYDSFKRAAN